MKNHAVYDCEATATGKPLALEPKCSRDMAVIDIMRELHSLWTVLRSYSMSVQVTYTVWLHDS